ARRRMSQSVRHDVLQPDVCAGPRERLPDALDGLAVELNHGLRGYSLGSPASHVREQARGQIDSRLPLFRLGDVEAPAIKNPIGQVDPTAPDRLLQSRVADRARASACV